MTEVEVKVASIDELLKRFEELSAQKTQGYSAGHQLFMDTINNSVIPEMNLIVNEIRSRVNK